MKKPHRTDYIQGTLFACSLGAVLFSVSGKFIFVLITGGSTLIGMSLGRLLDRRRRPGTRWRGPHPLTSPAPADGAHTR